MRRISILTAVALAVATPVSGSTLLPVGLERNADLWRVNTENLRSNAATNRREGLLNNRSQRRGANTPIFPVGSGSNFDPNVFSSANSSTSGTTSVFTSGNASAFASSSSSSSGGGNVVTQVSQVFSNTGGNGGSALTDIVAVPVPGSLPLLAGGFALLGFMARRKQA